MKRKRKQKPVVIPGLPVYARDSAEAKALRVLHDLVGRTKVFFIVSRRSDGSVSFVKPMTVQMTAFADAPDPSNWAPLTRQQAFSWEEFLGKVFDKDWVRQHMREGSRAPWPWPPSIEGKIYTEADGVPPLTEEDRNALASEGHR